MSTMHSGVASTCMSPTSRWRTAFSTTQTANCSSCRNSASLIFHTELGRIEAAPGEIVGDPAWHQVPGRTTGKAGARIHLRELWRDVPSARPGSDRRQRLANARDFLTPVAAYEDRDGEFRVTSKFCGKLWEARVQPLAAERGGVARQLRALQVRSGALQLHQLGHLRSSRSVDLHRADLALGDSRHSECGLRDLPAALDGCGAHLPSAVVPSQLHERVHGTDPAASTTRRPKASSPAARACTTA